MTKSIKEIKLTEISKVISFRTIAQENLIETIQYNKKIF